VRVLTATIKTGALETLPVWFSQMKEPDAYLKELTAGVVGRRLFLGLYALCLHSQSTATTARDITFPCELSWLVEAVLVIACIEDAIRAGRLPGIAGLKRDQILACFAEWRVNGSRVSFKKVSAMPFVGGLGLPLPFTDDLLAIKCRASGFGYEGPPGGPIAVETLVAYLQPEHKLYDRYRDCIANYMLLVFYHLIHRFHTKMDNALRKTSKSSPADKKLIEMNLRTIYQAEKESTSPMRAASAGRGRASTEEKKQKEARHERWVQHFQALVEVDDPKQVVRTLMRKYQESEMEAIADGLYVGTKQLLRTLDKAMAAEDFYAPLVAADFYSNTTGPSNTVFSNLAAHIDRYQMMGPIMKEVLQKFLIKGNCLLTDALIKHIRLAFKPSEIEWKLFRRVAGNDDFVRECILARLPGTSPDSVAVLVKNRGTLSSAIHTILERFADVATLSQKLVTYIATLDDQDSRAHLA